MGIINFLTSFDVFGEPISLNYKGDKSFKTFIGAFFTIMIKTFLMVYAGQQLLKLFSYDDPTIQIVSHTEFLTYLNVQFTKYSRRPVNETVNVGKNFGDLAFALHSKQY